MWFYDEINKKDFDFQRTCSGTNNFFLWWYYFTLVGNLTPCQKHQKEAKELSASGPNPWNFAPRCREDGGYYEVQCHVSTGQCWCVDQNGNERWGTVVRGVPDCTGMRKHYILPHKRCPKQYCTWAFSPINRPVGPAIICYCFCSMNPLEVMLSSHGKDTSLC